MFSLREIVLLAANRSRKQPLSNTGVCLYIRKKREFVIGNFQLKYVANTSILFVIGNFELKYVANTSILFVIGNFQLKYVAITSILFCMFFYEEHFFFKTFFKKLKITFLQLFFFF